MGQVQIILFGQLADILHSEKIVISNVPDTDALVKEIEERYPAMHGIQYMIAADKKVVNSNTPINEKTELALLPPFSGG